MVRRAGVGPAAGARIRPAELADARAIARVHVDTWRTAYRGIVDAGYLGSLSYRKFEERRRQRLAEPGTWTFVAEAAGEVVGFVTAGPNRTADPRHDAEIFAIYVRKSHAGQGLGKALVGAAARALSRAGFRSLLLWVLTANAPSRAFYESIGGSLSGQKSERFGSQDLPHVAYAWPSLRSLCRRLPVALPAPPAQNAPASSNRKPQRSLHGQRQRPRSRQ